MIDLAALASLFFEASKEWRAPAVVRLHRISDADREPVVQRLKAEGCNVRFVVETRLRQLSREGLKPVTERDKIGRPTVFMDRLQKTILVYSEQKT
jgi:hypothetical protein